MGTPFEPIIESYLVITEIKINPNSKQVSRKEYRNPDQILSNGNDLKLRHRTPALSGKATNLAKYEYIAALLLRNEILGCQQKALDLEGLLRNYRREFSAGSAKESRKLFTKLSSLRGRYNQGRLYLRQTMPPLYSFPWNKDGYIRHRSRPSIIAGFEYCKRVVLKARFIDPRFFTEQERSQYAEDKDVTLYHVPALADIQRIEAELGKPLYNSIEFPSGYGKGHTTI
jgi:hypothetical protein